MLQSVLTRAALACCSPIPIPFRYACRQPETTSLHRLVREYLETFREQLHTESGTQWPELIANELEGYLRCGILAHGLTEPALRRVPRGSSGRISREGWGFCPVCGARRMAQTAAHWVGEGLHDVPIRQWVLSLPIPLRLLLVAQPKLLTPVLNIV